MVKYLFMDVDGTLTDGKIYMSDTGELFKCFDIKDGCGIKDILPKYEIIPVIITARNSKILELRCKELNVIHVYQGVKDKYSKMLEIISSNSEDEGINLSNVAYIGDDILDLQCMIPIKEEGGLIGCPCNAVKLVRDVSDFISGYKGGDGAVRDFIEYIVVNNDV